MIFSDETQVVVGNDRRIYVWRKPDELHRPECVELRVGAFCHSDKYSRIAAMVRITFVTRENHNFFTQKLPPSCVNSAWILP